MKKYQYKVECFRANVTASEVEKDIAGIKVAQQVEQRINELMQQGFEFYRQFNSMVEVKPGCLAGLFGKKKDYIVITTSVFRKEIN